MHEKVPIFQHSSTERIVMIVDLTKPLDEHLAIYTEDAYSDPPFQIETWCTVANQGYRVARLALGTQTGTHIDAPAHFLDGGSELDLLPVDALIGRYLWLNLDAAHADDLNWDGERILFLASTRPEVQISEAFFRSLLELPCRVWVITRAVTVAGREPFHFNRALAQADKFLIEDVDETAAARVRAGGEMIALPLNLLHATGSPCRVIVRQTAP